MLCLSGFELYSRWVPLEDYLNEFLSFISKISIFFDGIRDSLL